MTVHPMQQALSMIRAGAEETVRREPRYLGMSDQQLAIEAARVDAMSSMVTNILCLVGTICVLFFWRFVYRPWTRAEHDYEDGGFFHFIAGAGLVLLGGALAAQAVFGLTDPWLYTAYFHPELWLAHKIVG